MNIARCVLPAVLCPCRAVTETAARNSAGVEVVRTSILDTLGSRLKNQVGLIIHNLFGPNLPKYP